MNYRHYLFDWGNTLMEDLPGQQGPMAGWPQIAVVEGAAELLHDLSQQGQCHLATNADSSNPAQIRQALQRGGLAPYISQIFCYHTTGYKKPQAEFFHSILRQLATPASSVLMTGDQLEIDVKAAQACGIDAIWFNRTGLACPPGINSVASLHELQTWLRYNDHC